jgi:hypothetical protein
VTAARSRRVEASPAPARPPRKSDKAALRDILLEAAREFPEEWQQEIKKLIEDQKLESFWCGAYAALRAYQNKTWNDGTARAMGIGFFHGLLNILLRRHALPSENKGVYKTRRKAIAQALRKTMKLLDKDEAAANFDLRHLLALMNIPPKLIKPLPYLRAVYVLSWLAHSIERRALGLRDPRLAALMAPQVNRGGRNGRERQYLEKQLSDCFTAYCGSPHDRLSYMALCKLFPLSSKLTDSSKIGVRRRKTRLQKRRSN